ncbi:hypothetical protein MKX08_007337 [Trichoderma sp. CBMAI-0020]|nr:hypothetical protein MKX08_007337 [Trichoderma sp. CBMAI-0020]
MRGARLLVANGGDDAGLRRRQEIRRDWRWSEILKGVKAKKAYEGESPEAESQVLRDSPRFTPSTVGATAVNAEKTVLALSSEAPDCVLRNLRGPESTKNESLSSALLWLAKACRDSALRLMLWISTALLVAGSDPRTMANAVDLRILLGQITSLVNSFSSAITPLSSSDEEEKELDMQLYSPTISRDNNAGFDQGHPGVSTIALTILHLATTKKKDEARENDGQAVQQKLA